MTQTYHLSPHLSPALLGITVSSALIGTVLAAIIDRFLVLFYYPETSNISLENMQHSFGID